MFVIVKYALSLNFAPTNRNRIHADDWPGATTPLTQVARRINWEKIGIGSGQRLVYLRGMRFHSLLLGALLVGLTCAQADILELKDGSVLNGTFLGSTAEVMRFRVGSLELEFPTGDVLALTMAGTPTPAPVPTPAPAVTPAVQPAVPAVSGNITIPAGTSLLVRMSDTVSTRNSAGRRFGARLESDLRVDGVLVAPTGSKLFGRVEESRQAGRMTGSAHLEIGLNEIKIRGTRFSIVTSDFRVRSGNSTANTAINTGVGAGIGAAFGGGRGAGRGAAVGAGASALSSGDHATISSGELIEFRMLEPLTVPR